MTLARGARQLVVQEALLCGGRMCAIKELLCQTGFFIIYKKEMPKEMVCVCVCVCVCVRVSWCEHAHTLDVCVCV